MERVVVVGCGGSGKTVLANRLGMVLGLPVTHLDALYYDEGWQSAPAEVFAARQQEVLDAPAWVLDGNYGSSMAGRLAAADTVVFLDLPGWVCLWGVLRRRLRYRGGQHADGVYDRVTLDFAWYVLTYRRKAAPRVRAMLTEHAAHADVVTLLRRRDVDAWLDRVSGRPR